MKEYDIKYFYFDGSGLLGEVSRTRKTLYELLSHIKEDDYDLFQNLLDKNQDLRRWWIGVNVSLRKARLEVVHQEKDLLLRRMSTIKTMGGLCSADQTDQLDLYDREYEELREQLLVWEGAQNANRIFHKED